MKNKPQIISVLLDISSQKERPNFIKSYAEFCKKQGYNTIILVLNAAVRTSVTPFFDPDESYTKEEIADIVDAVEAIGLDVVPAFENAFHMEKILCYKETERFAELEDEKAQGRGLSPAWSKHGSAGCLSNKEMFEFIDAYVSEVCSLFHSKYVHMGMDEVFEVAECDRCKKVLQNGKTKADMFRDLIVHNHDLVASFGREMMMWSDFFEYYDVLSEIPKDIIMCHWDYYFIGYEPRGKWTGRIKRDWFRIYDDLGFRYMFCSKAVDTSSAFNIDTLTRYADKFKPFGAMMTTWERAAGFYECLKPAVAYGGKLWNCGEGEKVNAIDLYADFLDGDKELAKAMLALYEPEIEFGYYDVTAVTERRHHVMAAYKSHLKYLLDMFETRNVSMANGGNPVLCDLYDNFSLRYARLSLWMLGDDVFDDYETGSTENLAFYDETTAEAIRRYKHAKENGDILYEKFKKGIVSSHGSWNNKFQSGIALAEKIRNDIHSVIGKKHNVLVVDLMLPDTYSMIKGEVFVKYKGEDGEKRLYGGTLKTVLTAFDVSGVYTLCFRCENKPIEYVIFNSYGEGDIYPVHFAYFNGTTKIDASRAEKLCGRVINEQNVLTYNVAFAETGYGKGEDHLESMALAKVKHGIKLYFKDRL